jgi:hypothetical protein
VIVRRRRQIGSAGAVFLSLLALSGREAHAAPLNVRLDYAAGPGCPDAAEFKAVVIDRLGYDPFIDGAPDQVLVRVAPRDRGVDGRIEWRDASGKWSGEQTFPSVTTDCPRLARTMGFALAVQIQLLARATAAPDASAATPPDARSEPAAPIPAQPVAATPPATGPTVATTAARGPSPPDGARPGLAFGAGPAVGFGMSSGPVLLGRLFGVVEWQHVSLELAALVGLPATTRRADGAGFSQQHLLGSAAACAAVAGATAARWSGCAVANAGAVRMVGDIDRPTSATVPIVEAGLRAGVRQPLGHHASLSAHADGLVNLTRWTGSLDYVPVWTAPRFAATLGIDASVQLP